MCTSKVKITDKRLIFLKQYVDKVITIFELCMFEFAILFGSILVIVDPGAKFNSVCNGVNFN
jgi:hypothetical protein